MPRMLLALLLPALAGAFVSTPAPALRASPWTGIHGLGWELRRPALVPLAHISRGGTVIAKSPSGAIGPSSDPPGRKPRRPRFPKLPKLPKFPKLESLPSPPPWLASVATRLAKYRGVWLVVLFALLSFALSRRSTPPVKVVELSYAAFMKLAANEGHRIESLRISLSRFVFLLDGMPAFTRPVRASSDLIWFLHANNIDFSAASTPIAAVLLPLFFPIVWLVALWSMLRRQMGGQQNVSKRASSRQLSADGLSFDDVAGIDSAKQEVKEVVSMLKNPARYAAAGARLPAGVLMVGPPGTGKTLLARVMAAQVTGSPSPHPTLQPEGRSSWHGCAEEDGAAAPPLSHHNSLWGIGAPGFVVAGKRHLGRLALPVLLLKTSATPCACCRGSGPLRHTPA